MRTTGASFEAGWAACLGRTLAELRRDYKLVQHHPTSCKAPDCPGWALVPRVPGYGIQELHAAPPPLQTRAFCRCGHSRATHVDGVGACAPSCDEKCQSFRPVAKI